MFDTSYFRFNAKFTIISLVILLSGSVGLVVGQGNYISAVTIAMLPFLVLFSNRLLQRPYLCLVLIVVSYILNVQISKFGISSNIAAITIILIAIATKKEKFVFLVGRLFFVICSLYITYILMSYFTSHNAVKYYDFNIYINNILIMLLMFCINTRTKVEVFYKAIVGSCLLLLFTGILQLISLGYMPAGYMTGYYDNHVMYALHMTFGLPFAYYLFKKTGRKRYLFFLALLLCGVVLAMSRGVIMAILLSVLTYAIIKIADTSRYKKIIFVLFSLFVLCGIIFSYHKVITQGEVGSSIYKTTSGRSLFYEAAWNMFKSQPFTGVGWDNYKTTWGDYVHVQKERWGRTITDVVLNPHSSYLKILSELGVIGLGLYFLVNFILLKDNWKLLLTLDGMPCFYVLMLFFFHGLVDNNSYGADRMFYINAGLMYSLRHMLLNENSDNLMEIT